MRLIPGWKRVASRSISMWSAYAGLAILAIPELIFWLWQIDTNPRLWWALSCATIIGGNILGRIIDQGGLDRDRVNLPVVVLFLALATLFWLPGMGSIPDKKITLETSLEPDEPEYSEKAALDETIPLVAKWEGLRTKAYKDVVGVWTVCFGQTKEVSPGDQYTERECMRMLQTEVAAYRQGLHRYFTIQTRTLRLTPRRDAAYTSLAYNVGIHGAGNSTAVRRINAGDIIGGCDALTWWNKAGGRVIRGLVNRRSEEHSYCMEGLEE